MSLMDDALQPHMIAGLMSLSGRTADIRLSELLISRGGGYDLEFDNSDESFSVDFRDSKFVVSAIAADCCRFASAAFQSIAPIKVEIVDKDTLAWGIVKLYYSAFYAGHALIRLFGESCSYLDRKHTSRVTSIGTAIGNPPTFRLDGGLYHCKINQAATALRYSKARGAGGGTHEAFWRIFLGCINGLTERVLLGSLVSSEAQQVFLQFRALENILSASGLGPHGALSSVRNDLQYKHSFGVWFPVKTRKRDREKLSRLSAQWQRDPMAVDLSAMNKNPLEQFTIACAFIVALCRSLLLRIADRSSAGDRCFICFGPIAFLRGAGLTTSN